MSFDPIAFDPARAARAVPARPAEPGGAPAGGFARALAAQAPAARVDAIPASPPSELSEQVLAAQRAVQQLHAQGRELRFDMDGGRLRIELRDLDGNVLREIPPTEALAIASGKAVR